MTEQAAADENPLLSALVALCHRVVAESAQPLNLLAEEAVLHWIRVVELQDVVQPRLNEQGYVPTAFHFGMEARSENRLDECGMDGGPEGFAQALEARLALLAGEVESYFEQPGYRSSSDRCDLMMLELARCSRFLNTWAADAEFVHRRRWMGRDPGRGETVHLYAPDDGEGLLAQARRQLALWEPLFNAAIVSWEENHLDPFDRGLREIRRLLQQPPADRLQSLPAPGYPLRRRGLARQKVSVFEPEQRPLRSRSVLLVRYHQLRERLEASPHLSPQVLEDLAVDVEHFSRMVETNLFMLASTPGFYERGRAGVPIIRGHPTNHPFFLDPAGFFKKAVLFHNGTYSAAGGGLDAMFLQLRQLERFCRFLRWGEWARALRDPIEGALIAWEENRWDGFTEGLLHVAEIFRAWHEEDAAQ